MIVTVSGKTYYGALDPGATAVPGEEGWPTPSFRRVGKGLQATYDVTPEQAREMASHLQTMSEGFAYGDDADTRAEGRAFRKDAERIRATLGVTT
jgi:hypothetical protein